MSALKRLVSMATLILVAPFVPLIRIPFAIHYWWMDVCYIYSEWLEQWRRT